MRTRLLLLSATTCAALVLSGCGDDEPEVRQGADPLPSATTSTTAPTQSPDATSSAAPSTTTAQPTPTGPPQAVTAPVQGGEYFAVYLAVTRDTDPPDAAQAAEAQAKAAGYDSGTSDLGCERGAAEALGITEPVGYLGTSIFFATAEDARAFVELYEPEVVGTAKITAFCLD